MLTGGVSQSVSQSARHRPRRTIGVHFSCLSSDGRTRRAYTHIAYTHTRARARTPSTRNFASVFLRALARAHARPLLLGPVFPPRFFLPVARPVRGPVCQCASSDYRPISAEISPKFVPEPNRSGEFKEGSLVDFPFEGKK